MIQLAPLDRDKLRALTEDILMCKKELVKLTDLSKEEFLRKEHSYAVTEHFFRRALEGILTAGTHILSRLPIETKDYTAIIQSLGKAGVISPEFAQRNKGLAGYRNRLVHMYWEVTVEELYDTVREHLEDIEKFAEAFIAVQRNPKKFGLS